MASPPSSVSSERHTPFAISLLAGGLAGTSVDLALFPIDTIKTRLQSPQGLVASGGFRGVYRGVLAAAGGGAPGAALFFGTYETMKPIVSNYRRRSDDDDGADGQSSRSRSHQAPTHMISASIGEAAACLVRVPTEVIKSRMQTNAAGSSTVASTLRSVLSERDGRSFGSSVLGGLYRGYGITLMREVPFAVVQFPLYERLKLEWGRYQGRDASPAQAAACGSFAGGVAAAITTPLDVVKTRLMLGSDGRGVPYRGVVDATRRLANEGGGYSVFVSGIQPRVIWISVGGFVFFGAYESYRSFLMSCSGSYFS
ncbi:hypothetical protein ACHAW5_000838 [Stephanodiscus triporus]|uniref:Mitochondrial carrier protein n=1 Tax=Stephanodiscus triporus TaxID=2934178 RepID=A0ABD3NYV9_9STRA